MKLSVCVSFARPMKGSARPHYGGLLEGVETDVTSVRERLATTRAPASTRYRNRTSNFTCTARSTHISSYPTYNT